MNSGFFCFVFLSAVNDTFPMVVTHRSIRAAGRQFGYYQQASTFGIISRL